MTPAAAFEAACQTAVTRVPMACRPWGRGWSAALAGIIEAAAAKPGNVHPGAAFPDLSFDELAAAAIATAPALDAAADTGLGQTILAAVRSSRAVTRSNANLGIVLLLAPLAAVPGRPTPAGVATVLEAAGPADATAVWEAISVARPGGLGRSSRWDVTGPPPPDLRVAMRHAADRDTVARLWTMGFESLFDGPVNDLASAVAVGRPLADAILETFLRQLAREPDSLILRRHGRVAAEEVRRRAERVAADWAGHGWSAEVSGFDAWLRRPNRLNPGTTADLVAAALYILLRDGRLRAALPFPTPPLATG